MRKLIRIHQKKIVAAAMILLMISFAASSGNRTNNNRGDALIGRIGKTKIYGSESMEAHQEWKVLTQNIFTERANRFTGEPEVVPFAVRIFPDDLVQSDNAADLFMLLRHEARDAGVRANPDEVESIMTNNYHRPPGADDGMDEVAREAVTDALLIGANFSRLASNVKISLPARDHFLAQAAQSIELNVVELSQSDYLAKVPLPTTQQAQDQFNKYADVIPGIPDEKNPFGFGYRLADSVKLQYIAINRNEATKTVESSKTPYEWDVQARLYYRQHPAEFATTQPTTMAIGPTTAPTQKPYPQVADQALKSLRDPLIDKLMFEVQGKIVSTMQTDWHAYTASATTANSAYPSYAYLNNLAKQIQTQFGMSVYATELNRDFLSQKDLEQQSGIGRTTNGRIGFPEYALQLASPFLKSADKSSPTLRAQLMQPAMPLHDFENNVYIFRLTDARSAQPASSLAEVATKVDSDLRAQAAYQLANDAAAALLTAADKGSLTAAATTAGKAVWTTAPFTNTFDRSPVYLGSEINLSETGEKTFVQKSFALLSQYNPARNPHPATLIPIPPDGKIYVAQLATLSAKWNGDDYYQAALMSAAQLRSIELAKIRTGWLQYDAVVKRLSYKPENEPKDTSS